MERNKIVPCIWFSSDKGDVSKVISYYKNIFESDFEAEKDNC